MGKYSSVSQTFFFMAQIKSLFKLCLNFNGTLKLCNYADKKTQQ